MGRSLTMGSRLERLWRQCGTGISFALFGIGGLFLTALVFPAINVVYRDRARRAAAAQRTVHAAWRLFVGVMAQFPGGRNHCVRRRPDRNFLSSDSGKKDCDISRCPGDHPHHYDQLVCNLHAFQFRKACLEFPDRDCPGHAVDYFDDHAHRRRVQDQESGIAAIAVSLAELCWLFVRQLFCMCHEWRLIGSRPPLSAAGRQISGIGIVFILFAPCNRTVDFRSTHHTQTHQSVWRTIQYDSRFHYAMWTGIAPFAL